MNEPEIEQLRFEDLAQALKLDTECLSRPWSAGVWRDELRSPHSKYFAIRDEERIVAQIGVKIVLDEMHVMTLAVHPEYRRQGYARALVNTVLQDNPQARSLYLEVRMSNVAARSLYQSLGFGITAHRPGYYGDEDAILMTLTL